MSITACEPEVALVRLRRARRVLVVGHCSPDGDSLGSQLALVELLDQLGISSVAASHDPLPDSLQELPGSDRVLVSPELPPGFPDDFDLVVTVECSELSRCGFTGIDALPLLSIDHHQASAELGEVNYLDVDSPAVGEMIWRLYREADLTPSVTAATNMYVALSTDTGDFRYSNATPRAFATAAALVEAGAAPEKISEWIHERRNAASVRLLGEALRTLTLDCDGRLAMVWIDRAAFDRAAASPGDTEDIINVPRSIAGVQVVAFLKQWQPGEVRVSLRSKGELDVCDTAVRLGGGGHRNASGCTLHSELATARDTILHELKRMLESCP